MLYNHTAHDKLSLDSGLVFIATSSVELYLCTLNKAFKHRDFFWMILIKNIYPCLGRTLVDRGVAGTAGLRTRLDRSVSDEEMSNSMRLGRVLVLNNSLVVNREKTL